VFHHTYKCPRPPASPEGLQYYISRYHLGWQPSGYAMQSCLDASYTVHAQALWWQGPQYPYTAVTMTINKNKVKKPKTKAMDKSLQT
jgi:hypothetical protein